MKLISLSIILASFLIALNGCSKSVDSDLPPDPVYRSTSQLTAAEKSLVISTNSFAFKLFKEIAASENPDSNIT